MQENKIRLNSFLAIPKRVDKHGTAVKAVEEQKKSGWIKNDQLWIKTLYIGLTVYYSSDTWLLQLD